MTRAIFTILVTMFLASTAYLYQEYDLHRPLTAEERAILDRHYNPPETEHTRGLSTTMPPPVFAAVAINVSWADIASIIGITSTLLGLTYWLISHAVVKPMLQEELKEMERRLMANLVSAETFDAYRESDQSEHRLLREEMQAMRAQAARHR